MDSDQDPSQCKTWGAGGVNAEDGSAKELSIETLERELEDVLLNTFINHNLFCEHFPLKVKIDVSNASLFSSLQKDYHKQVHVELNLDSSISQHPSISTSLSSADVINIEDSCDEEAEDTGDKKPAPGLDISNDDITDSDTDSQVDTTTKSVEDGCPQRLEKIQSLLRIALLKRKANFEEDQEENKMNSKKILINKDNMKKKVTEVLLPPMEMESGSEVHKGKKNFSLDQDKEILDKVIQLLPQKSFPDLELPDIALKLLSEKISRSEISIQQRWKYSLREWIVQFHSNSKATKSWEKTLSKKASVQRRKDVSEYFRKLVDRKDLKLEAMGVKAKPVVNVKAKPAKDEKKKPIPPVTKGNLIHSVIMTKRNRN